MANPVRRQWLSNALVCAGLLLLGAALLPTAFGRIAARLELARFQSSHAETAAWAPGRVGAYRRALRLALAPPEAVLRIRSAGMEVPVLKGTSDLVLNRGAGHLAGTAAPGAEGNLVLAGHRDGFFRHLKDVSAGDTVEVLHDGVTDTYRVDGARVVERGDTSMLRDGSRSMLTLITCYPFFFVGPAPQRYVVTATRIPNPTQPLQARLH